ncbi:cyclophilin 13 [Novymonas esmeraldas]|uniref:Cyclophilin 13 n=1 Tax=Novymonas esmeraldas TaxID=1808958 RepID=A0AAW0ENA0_9TRYP
MHALSTRHLGGTHTPGSTLSGTRYVSHTSPAPRTSCWMELAVFTHFPIVPSLAGTRVQSRHDLLASTAGAGAPEQASLVLQIELFDDECPQLCSNFRCLCAGQSSTRQGQVYCHQGLTPSYCGTYFHKIIPGYCVQGGDITMRVAPGGTNAYSSAGRTWLPDESKKRRHNERGLVSMANNGPNSNGSQFFITTSATQERAFNGRHCCIGRVVHGLDAFLTLVAPFGNVEGHPSKYAVVVDCGLGEAPTALNDTAPQSVPMTTAPETPRTPTAPPQPLPLHEHHLSHPQRAAESTAAVAAVTPSATAAAAAAAAEAANPATPSQPLKSSLKRKPIAPSEATEAPAKHVTYQL